MRSLQQISLLFSIFLTTASLAACDATIANDEAGSGDTGGGEQGWSPCSANSPCPDGQFCFNGLCAVGCQSDGDCADNQYCDTAQTRLCQNREVPTCSGDEDCASSQVCINQFCSTPPEDTSCNPDNILDDGCNSNAVCLAEAEGEAGACYTMPACAADGSCPVGVGGAVCNQGYLPNKDKICLLGGCEDDSNCPDQWSCVRFPANAVLGACSSGIFGAPCTAPEHCQSGVCNVIPNFGGFCQ